MSEGNFIFKLLSCAFPNGRSIAGDNNTKEEFQTVYVCVLSEFRTVSQLVECQAADSSSSSSRINTGQIYVQGNSEKVQARVL